jgi:hypothetical protein
MRLREHGKFIKKRYRTSGATLAVNGLNNLSSYKKDQRR